MRLPILLVLTLLMPSVGAAPTGRMHRVRKGESAIRISRAKKVPLSQLRALNPGIDLDRLRPGDRLRLSGPRTAERRQLLSQPDFPPCPLQPLPLLAELGPLPVDPEYSAPAVTHLTASLQPVLGETGPIEPAPLGFDPADPNQLDLLWPVETRTVSSGYGPRIRSRVKVVASKKTKKRRRIRVPYRSSHQGIDLNAPQGTDVFASHDGRVLEAGFKRLIGNYVLIDHGNGVETLYGHNRRNFAQAGDLVRRGQKIAEVGRTGRATGPHVHFELRLNGMKVNPTPYLNDVEEIPEEILTLNSLATPHTSR